MTTELLSFDTQPRTRLVFGNNTLERLGEFARELEARRVLVVTDPGIVGAGHVERACKALNAAGVEAVVYDRVRENPTTRDAENCRDAAQEAGIDLFVGLGGGSSLDTAKGGNFLLTNGGKMADYRGHGGKVSKPMLPLIAIPTTAGTGSECQSYAIIADEETHLKMACGDPKAAARIALLDPILTVSQPRAVTACTGMDAIVHAVETAVTRKRSAFSLLYSREAFRLMLAYFPVVLQEPGNLEARAGMLLGAAFAGTAIENSMLGAAHSAANPLTAHYGIVHGQAVGMMLPHIIRFNAAETEAQQGYQQLALAAGLTDSHHAAEVAIETLIAQLQTCLSAAGLPASLAECGVEAALIPTLAVEAAAQWTAQFNPRSLVPADFEAIYRAAL